MKLVTGKRSGSCIYTFFYFKGSKFSLLLLYWKQFARYRPIFKIAIFGHWQSCRSCAYTQFYLRGSNIDHIFALLAAVSEICDDFHNCHTWGHETWPLAKVLDCIYTICLPQKVDIKLILAVWAAVSKIRADLFFSTAGHFQDNDNFSFSHWPQC